MLIATTVGSELTPTRYTQPELDCSFRSIECG